MASGTGFRSAGDADLVRAARSGEQQAFTELFERWFDRVWNVARGVLRDDERAAEVAQDALLAAWQQLDRLDDPEAFGGWLLRIGRNRALNRLQKEQRSTSVGDDVISGLHDRGASDPTGSQRLIDTVSISEVRDRQELLWAAAAALGERDASLLDLHLRHGLTAAELADELDVSPNNAHQLLFRLRGKLGDAVANYLLWRNGRPLCDALARAVSGDVAFDASVAKAVAKHQASCSACGERRSELVDPQRLFASVPLAAVPLMLRTRAAEAMQAELAKSAGPGPSGPGSSGSGVGRPGSPRGAADAERVDERADDGAAELVPVLGNGGPRRSRSFLRGFMATLVGLLVAAGVLGWLGRPVGQGDEELLASALATSTITLTTQPATNLVSTTLASTTLAPAPTTPTSIATSPTTPAPPTVTPSPDTTAETTTETTGTTGTTADPGPIDPPPEIVRFDIAPSPVAGCSSRSEVHVRAVWLSELADSASLALPSGSVSVPVSGDLSFCVVPGTSITLTVSGLGGKVARTETA